ncbi:cardiolipin synthase [Domibacillus indicus]|uniref:cardiolipin synthase n=1 Tax=Domibacillus indicus TaxID=1437523 RepID=UPI00061817C0|nr:cardiolipin synthase [Domibacillus indicus]
MREKIVQLFTLIIVVSLVYFSIRFYSNQLSIVFTYLAGAISVLVVLNLLLFDSRGTNSKVAWSAVILAFPLAGAFVYAVFGRDPRRRLLPKQVVSETIKFITTMRHLGKEFDISDQLSEAKNIRNMTGFEAIGGNKVDVLTNGEETFPAILEAIRHAEHHIHIQYYIFRDDEISTQIRDALIERAKANVHVRFLVDGLGCSSLPASFLKPLREAGGEAYAFDSIVSPWLTRTANLRNHRKMVVVDGHTGFTGGLNVGEEYLSNTPHFKIWRDTHIRVEGPAVRQLQEAFVTDWIHATGAKTSLLDELKEPFRFGLYFPSRAHEADQMVQTVYGGPYNEERDVRDAMLEMIQSAEKSIWIASPYFVPDDEALAAIRVAARSGKDVRVIVPGKGDRSISFYGTNSYFQDLLSAGVKVFAYRNDSFIHAKVLLIDNVHAIVGTANFDVRSFRLNHELMTFLYNRTPAVEKIEIDFLQDFAESVPVSRERYEHRTFLKRIGESLARLLSPIL